MMCFQKGKLWLFIIIITIIIIIIVIGFWMFLSRITVTYLDILYRN